MKVYCFDIDGTLCSNTDGDYESAEPFPERIEKVNSLKASGCVIKLFTARGSTTGQDWTQLTQAQLALWGIDYDELILGKPHYDLLVDDKAAHSDEFFGLLPEAVRT